MFFSVSALKCVVYCSVVYQIAILQSEGRYKVLCDDRQQDSGEIISVVVVMSIGITQRSIIFAHLAS